MKILLIGPQGSGKGTQAKMISQRFGIPHVSSGDLFRNLDKNSEIGKQVNEAISKGEMITDDVTLQIINNRISNADCKNGFILDGFPRNVEQAEQLRVITELDVVITIELSDNEALRRLGGRVICEKCKADFNYATMPPKQEGVCDKCRGRLIKREDDREEAIMKRLDYYHNETEKLIEYYENKGIRVKRVDGEKSVGEVFSEIERVLR